MKQAKLKTKTYDCLDVRQANMNDGANQLNLILTNIDNVSEVIEEATDCDKIEILEDGTVTQIYEDYTTFVSESLVNDEVSIVVCQPSLVQQVANLKATVKAQADVIATQEATIAELEASQEQQDVDINDVTDAVLEMSEYVYGQED